MARVESDIEVKVECVMSNEKSRYATKRESGRMMYGPGCCAHNLVITAERRAQMSRMCKERDDTAKRAHEQKMARRLTIGDQREFYG